MTKPTHLPPILLADSWRAAVFDSAKGLVVLDVTASNEAEAKGRAATAAKDKLGCKDVKSVTVVHHFKLPNSLAERIGVDLKIH